MNICNCTLPENGGKAYDCPRLGCRMTPHFCELYATRENYRAKWDDGWCPGDVVPNQPQPARQGGPGTELKRLLARLGIKPKSCPCNRRAAEMDRRGPEWCRKNINRIAGWLLGEAKKRNWKLASVSRPAIKVLIRWAIRRSERRHTE